eukprot:2257918-Pleurochrysis_carterae.AAC.6
MRTTEADGSGPKGIEKRRALCSPSRPASHSGIIHAYAIHNILLHNPSNGRGAGFDKCLKLHKHQQQQPLTAAFALFKASSRSISHWHSCKYVKRADTFRREKHTLSTAQAGRGQAWLCASQREACTNITRQALAQRAEVLEMYNFALSKQLAGPRLTSCRARGQHGRQDIARRVCGALVSKR